MTVTQAKTKPSNLSQMAQSPGDPCGGIGNSRDRADEGVRRVRDSCYISDEEIL